tara:strand:+ start:7219 stop:7662 length:444 start_codon:yes stop_codon:yes gene_type:complete
MEKITNSAIIYENIYFKLYLSGENLDNVYVISQPKEMQEKYDSNDVLSHEKKIKLVDELMEYFYNYWMLIKNTNDTKMYTLNIDLNLIMINIPIHYYLKIKQLLDSLKSVIETNLTETYFKVTNPLAKYFLDLVLTLYKPVKPIHII